MNAPEATATCEHCEAPIEMRRGIWWHSGSNLLSCDQSVPLWESKHAWPATDNAETPPEGFTFEYAVQLGDGTYLTDYGEYHLGEIVATWTDFAAAQSELFRARTNGIDVHGGNDSKYRDAQLVRRLVPAWSPISFMGYPRFQEPTEVVMEA